MSSFHYGSLIWDFSSAQMLKKNENLQIRALLFSLNYYRSIYENLLEKFECRNMNLRRQRTLCITGYMNESFKLRNIDNFIRGKYKPNLKIPIPNQVTLGGSMDKKYGMPNSTMPSPTIIDSNKNKNI